MKRPFWSVMIPTYQPNLIFLEQTLNSILQQASDEAEMQIEVVDDGSPNETLATWVEKIGQGRIQYYRQPKRRGLGGCWNTCIERAKGEWIHILHHDDLVLPGFYDHLKNGIKEAPEIGAAFTQFYLIDEENNRSLKTRLRQEKAGILKNWLQYVFVDLSIQTPAIVVKKEVYEKLGGFRCDMHYSLDWEMWKRIASQYPIWFEPKPLACYRMHAASETSRLNKEMVAIRELRKSIEANYDYLPPELAAQTIARAKKNYIFFTTEKAAEALFREKNSAHARAFFQEAQKFGSTLDLWGAVFKLGVRACTPKMLLDFYGKFMFKQQN